MVYIWINLFNQFTWVVKLNIIIFYSNFSQICFTYKDIKGIKSYSLFDKLNKKVYGFKISNIDITVAIWNWGLYVYSRFLSVSKM